MLAVMAFMAAWQGSLNMIVAATKNDAQQGDYYGPDGQVEISGFPALAVINDAALDDKVANSLWRKAQEFKGIAFP